MKTFPLVENNGICLLRAAPLLNPLFPWPGDAPLTLITMAGVPDVFITGENYCSNLYNQG